MTSISSTRFASSDQPQSLLHQTTPPQALLKILAEVKPEHGNAAKALYYPSPMRSSQVSGGALLQGIELNAVKKNQTPRWLRPSQHRERLTTLTHQIQIMAADRVAHHVNESQAYEINHSAIKQLVTEELNTHPDPMIAGFASKYSESVTSTIDQLLKTASKLRVDQNIDRHVNFKTRMSDAITQLQHRAFLSNTSWNQIKPAVREYLIDSFSNNDPYGSHNPEQVMSLVDELLKSMDPGYSCYFAGSRFKANKAAPTARLESTQIRSANGRIFALINTPTLKQARQIQRQHNPLTVQPEKKIVLGEGAFGKVRLAEDLQSGEIVAVKKFDSHDGANTEIQQYENLGHGPRFVALRDYAHIRQIDNLGFPQEKSYLFTALANAGDGRSMRNKLAELRKNNPLEAERQLRTINIEYTGATADMHAKGVYHHDIKPSNFLHTITQAQDPTTGITSESHKIFIADYGLSKKAPSNTSTSSARRVCPGGTKGYLPPEDSSKSRYSNAKHDAFSLGMTLLEMKLGDHPRRLPAPQITLPGGMQISFIFDQNKNCKEIKTEPKLESHELPLTSDINIILNLLALTPEKRISAKKAHNAFKQLAAIGRG